MGTERGAPVLKPVRRSSVLGALSWFATSYGFALLGYLGANAIASRWLGLADYTDFVIALTVSTVLGQLALVGAHRGGLREAALWEDGDDSRLVQLRADARAALLVTLPLTGLLSGGVAFTMVDGSMARRVGMAVGFAVLVVLGGQQKLWASFLRGLGDVRLSSLLEGRSGGAAVSLLQVLALAVAWAMFPGSGLLGAVVALALGYLVPVLLAKRRVARRWSHLEHARGLWWDLRSSVARNWRFGANQLTTFLNGNVELWVAALLLADTQASLFSSAQRLVLLLSIPLTSMQVVFAPVTARLLAARETTHLEAVLRTGASAAAVLAGVILVPMLIFPREFLELVFGGGFGAAASALTILTVGTIANVASGLSGTVLTMSHHEGLAAVIQTVGVVLRIVLGAVGATLAGLQGLAVTSSVVAVVTFGVLWWQAHRLLGVWTHPTSRPRLGALRKTLG